MENKELKERFIDEKTGIEYVRQGDYYIPNLVLPKQKQIHFNKYGRMRLNYLKEHKKAEYTILFMENTLIDHLEEIQEIATKKVNQIIEDLKAKSNSTEDILYCYHVCHSIDRYIHLDEAHIVLCCRNRTVLQADNQYQPLKVSILS